MRNVNSNGDVMKELFNELSGENQEVMVMLAKSIRFAQQLLEYRMTDPRSHVLGPAQDASEGSR